MTNEVVVPNATAVAMPTEWADRLAQFATQAQQARASRRSPLQAPTDPTSPLSL